MLQAATSHFNLMAGGHNTMTTLLPTAPAILAGPGTPAAPSVLALTWPGQISQARQLRPTLTAFLADCPVTAEAVTLAWELTANACLHSASGLPGGRFTIRVRDFPGDYVHAEITDQGSNWDGDLAVSTRAPHGLYLLRELSATCGTAGGRCARTVWFTISYPAPAAVPARTIPSSVPATGRSAA
jgi:serine/threonine-protein kinase RsbW